MTEDMARASLVRSIVEFSYNGYKIPAYMAPGLAGWILEGRPVGGFMSAVLRNDLMAALQKADENNLKNLPAYGAYLYNRAPSGCFGSPKAVIEWAGHDGMKGKSS